MNIICQLLQWPLLSDQHLDQRSTIGSAYYFINRCSYNRQPFCCELTHLHEVKNTPLCILQATYNIKLIAFSFSFTRYKVLPYFLLYSLKRNVFTIKQKRPPLV